MSLATLSAQLLLKHLPQSQQWRKRALEQGVDLCLAGIKAMQETDGLK